MGKAIVSVAIVLLVLGIVGCGNELESPTEPVQEILRGLSEDGSTYMNTKFGVSISNLPTEGWTVKALGSDGQGLLESGSQFSIPMYHLLLMEPVPEDEFVDMNATESIAPVVDAGIPCILVALDYLKDGEFETHNLIEDLEWYAASRFSEIESKKMIGVGKDTGIQAVLLRNDWSAGLKEALTWFAKGELRVRCEYIAKEPEYRKYFIAYQRVAQSIVLMGK